MDRTYFPLNAKSYTLRAIGPKAGMSILKSVIAELLDKEEDDVTDADMDRIDVVEMENQRDGEIWDVVMVDDVICGRMSAPITQDDLGHLSRI